MVLLLVVVVVVVLLLLLLLLLVMLLLQLQLLLLFLLTSPLQWLSRTRSLAPATAGSLLAWGRGANSRRRYIQYKDLCCESLK